MVSIHSQNAPYGTNQTEREPPAPVGRHRCTRLARLDEAAAAKPLNTHECLLDFARTGLPVGARRRVAAESELDKNPHE